MSKLKISPVRAQNILQPRYSLGDANLLGPSSGIFSPNGAASPSISSASINSMLVGCYTLEDKERILSKEVGKRQSWKYVAYNELARIQYALAQELNRYGDTKTADVKYQECLESISEAKRLVDANSSSANTKYKSIVYYNHSQFTAALCLSDKAKQKEALESIDKAIELCPGGDIDYKQDCLVHKSFILPYVNRLSDAKSLYQEAFKINPERFVATYTSEGSGKELIFFIIANDMDDLLDLLVHHMRINPNTLNDLGWSPLYVAVQRANESIIDHLLRLGADPLYKSPGADNSPLLSALLNGSYEIAKQMLQKLAEESRIQDIAWSDLKLALESPEDLEEDAADKIRELLKQFDIKLDDILQTDEREDSLAPENVKESDEVVDQHLVVTEVSGQHHDHE